MRCFVFLLFVACTGGFVNPAVVWGHHPHNHAVPIGPRCDPIPPLGNRLPPSYRRVYNRPTYVGGKIAYYIAPSSQEAMSWHEHVHRGSYRNHAGRIEPMYLYPKPWEVLTLGPRTPKSPTDEVSGPSGEGTSGDPIYGESDTEPGLELNPQDYEAP